MAGKACKGQDSLTRGGQQTAVIIAQLVKNANPSGLWFSLAEGSLHRAKEWDPTVPRRFVGMEVEKPRSHPSGTTLGGEGGQGGGKKAKEKGRGSQEMYYWHPLDCVWVNISFWRGQ